MVKTKPETPQGVSVFTPKTAHRVRAKAIKNIVDISHYFDVQQNPPPPTGDYLVDMVWWTEKFEEIPLGKMTRNHVRNALQWCIRKQPADRLVAKDRYTYQEWITAFTVRLLDPDLP
jgi:hypothetical protein